MRLLIGGTALALVGLSLGVRAWRRTAEPPRYRPRTIGLMAVTGVSLAAYQPLFFLGTERNGVAVGTVVALGSAPRSEEHTSELQSLMRISYAVFCLKKNNKKLNTKP